MTKPKYTSEQVEQVLQSVERNKAYWDNPNRVRLPPLSPHRDSPSGYEIEAWILAWALRGAQTRIYEIEKHYWDDVNDAVEARARCTREHVDADR